MTRTFELIIGIDRSDSRLDIATFDPLTASTTAHTVSTDPAALRRWFEHQRQSLPAQARIGVAFEEPATNLIVFFSQFEGVSLYPLNPAAVRSYCKSFAISGAHTDTTDAAMIDSLAPRSSHPCGSPRPGGAIFPAASRLPVMPVT